MNSNELRIGNIIGGLYEETEFEKLHKIHVFSLGQNLINGSHPDRWKPIPITEAILISLGFILNMNHEHPAFDEYVLKDDNSFGIGNFNGMYWLVDFLDQSYGSPELKYIHELQNLYHSITGLELAVSHNT